MAIASSSFIAALNYTTVANVLFLQAASPVLAAALAWAFLGERVTRRTVVAMTLAVAGVGVIVGGPSAGSMLGLALALAMTLAFSVAIVITRHRRDMSMAPANCLAQLVVLAAAAPFATPGEVGGRDLTVLVLLGVFQMGLGLAFLTIGARHLPAAEVALITLLEIVLGPLWVWALYAETPATATLFGGAVIVAAVAVQASGGRRPGTAVAAEAGTRA
jgi:drug/metabolite transporter (DMT)-like permease